MVTTQIICSECKTLQKVENKQVVSHFAGDMPCPMSGTKYVPQRCTFSTSEAPAEMMAFVDSIPLPPGAEVVSARMIKCEEHDKIVGGIAIIRAEKTANIDASMESIGAEPIGPVETRGPGQAVSKGSFDAPLPVGKYGTN